MSSRAEKSRQLRQVLSRYRGGRFEASSSGGAGGMVFWIDSSGRQWFIGGFQPDRAEDLVSALNLVMELLETSTGTSLAPAEAGGNNHGHEKRREKAGTDRANSG